MMGCNVVYMSGLSFLFFIYKISAYICRYENNKETNEIKDQD